MSNQSTHLHGGDPQSYIKKFDLKTTSYIDFSVNVNHVGAPEQILVKWDGYQHLVNSYPQISGSGVKAFYSQKFNVNEASILAGNGSIECIYLAPRALNIKSATIIQPSFYDYEKSLKLIDAKIEKLFLSASDKFSFPGTEKLETALLKTDALFLGNPNNPTGTLVEANEIIALADKYPDKWFFIDEAFIQYVKDANKYSLINNDRIRKNIIVFHSLTKFYSLPGLRLGIAFSHPDTIQRVEFFKEPWTINGIANAVCYDLLECQTYEELTRKHCWNEQNRLYSQYKKVQSLEIFKPAANFFLAQWKGTHNLDDLIVYLLERGIYIRDCRNFTQLNNGFFRFAIRSEKENNLLLKSIQNFDASLK